MGPGFSLDSWLRHGDFFQAFQAEPMVLTWPREPGILESHKAHMFYESVSDTLLDFQHIEHIQHHEDKIYSFDTQIPLISNHSRFIHT